MELTSKPVGRILKAFLLTSMVVSMVDTLGVFFNWGMKVSKLGMASGETRSISSLETVFGMISVVVWLMTGVLFLIWFFKVHADLQKVTAGEYRITPGGAMARMLIPIYSIYGSWHVFWVMSSYFKEKDQTFRLGKILMGMIPVFYILTWGTNIFDQLFSRGALSSQSFYGIILALELLLNIIYYMMTKIIMEAIEIDSK